MPSKRHPALANTPRGVFCPEAVGVVPGYPKTPEKFEAACQRLRDNSKATREAGKLNRRGVRNGWAGQKARSPEMRTQIASEAWRIVGIAMASSWLSRERIAEIAVHPEQAQPGEERAAVCLALGLEIILSPTFTVATRLSMARMILPYVKGFQASNALATLSDAVSFLHDMAKCGSDEV